MSEKFFVYEMELKFLECFSKDQGYSILFNYLLERYIVLLILIFPTNKNMKCVNLFLDGASSASLISQSRILTKVELKKKVVEKRRARLNVTRSYHSVIKDKMQ